MLRHAGFRAQGVTNLDEAMQLLASDRKDPNFGVLLFTEANNNGRESPLARHVRSKFAESAPLLIKLVPISTMAELDVPDIDGADAWLSKPATRHGFLAALNQAAGGPHSSVDQLPEHCSDELLDVTVLLVEDNALNAQIGIELLTPLGCKVVRAVNGADAVSLFSAQHFDLVLMDCQMPVMDGFEATQRIRHLEASGNRLPPAGGFRSSR